MSFSFDSFTYSGEMAQRILTSGAVVYVASALPGTQAADAKWQVKRIETAGDLVTITWADGNAKFDNVATNLAALSYS